MVIQKESCSDVKRNEDIYRIMFMCSQNEEDSKEIQDPGQGVQEVPAPWCIWEKTESDYP